MISVVLVITLLLPGAKPIAHRAVMPSAEDCVKRGAEFAADTLATMPSGGKLTIGCEFTKR